MKIILMNYKFGGLVTTRQFVKFSLSPNFVVIWYLGVMKLYSVCHQSKLNTCGTLISHLFSNSCYKISAGFPSQLQLVIPVSLLVYYVVTTQFIRFPYSTIYYSTAARVYKNYSLRGVLRGTPWSTVFFVHTSIGSTLSDMLCFPVVLLGAFILNV